MVRRLRREDYTVGWVCALSVELAAAQEMLDEEDDTPLYSAHDTNLYTCGRVGQHNVVIACLPEGQFGTNSAAAVAVQMKSTFSSTRFGLMVGIGGGVPSEETDVRLGDIVVSKPNNTHGGVVQYDAGKATPSGFERTGSLNTPPIVLLNAIANLRARQMRGRSRLADYLAAFNSLPGFTRDAAGPDILYNATYDHVGGPTCRQCDGSHSVIRSPRRQEVVVHYGLIASGNQVIRSATERDRVSADLGGVLCFEMEAAGLMHSFPCLVIRGICDYADSHKNKCWQAYAAGTAAAYAKELLSVIPPTEISNTHTVDALEMRALRQASTPSRAVRTPASSQQYTVPTHISHGLFASPESLCIAIQRSDIDGVQALIASCSDSVETLLTPIPCSNNPELVRIWKNYWGIYTLDRTVTALHCAVENDGEQSAQILQLLLRILPRSAVDPVGHINLIQALNSSARILSMRTVALAPDIDGRRLQNCTVLSWAAMLGNFRAVNILKDAGAKINSRENWLRVTPLMAQCFLTGDIGGEAITVSLVRGGALLDLQDDRGNTALHLAAATRKPAIITALLNAGASVQVRNLDGATALGYGPLYNGYYNRGS